MTQLVNIFVQDISADPVVGATIGFNNRNNGLTYFAITNGVGLASIPLPEDLYAVSVAKPDFTSPVAINIEVSAAPAATAAFFNPPATAASGMISATAKNIELAIDGGSFVVVDVTNGVNSVPDAATIAANINVALGALVATDYFGEIRLLSTTVGVTSEIVIKNDGTVTDDATELVFGIPLGASSLDNVTVFGEDSPLDWNDFDMVLTPFSVFVSTDPDHCMLFGRFYRHDTRQPLVGATVWIEVRPAITAIDVGIDVGDSFEVKTDKDGYLVFELMRNARATMFMNWQDLVIDFTVPNAASANLDALISPYVVFLTINQPPAVAMTVGQDLAFSPTRIFTDGSTLQSLIATYFSSDASVATFDSTGRLTANAVGTATVTVSFVNSRNETITSDPIVVTVSP